MDDKFELRSSQAGMRFIAQMTIFNSGNFERLRTYITESYHPDLLAKSSVDERLADFRAQLEQLGRLRVVQLLAAGKHHVMVLLEAEQSEEFRLNNLQVEEDYPHRIIEYSLDSVEVEFTGDSEGDA